jgi:hypothetical protein
MAETEVSIRIDLKGGRIGPGKIALLEAMQNRVNQGGRAIDEYVPHDSLVTSGGDK